MAHFFNFLHALSNPALSSCSPEESSISGPMSFRTYGYHKMDAELKFFRFHHSKRMLFHRDNTDILLSVLGICTGKSQALQRFIRLLPLTPDFCIALFSVIPGRIFFRRRLYLLFQKFVNARSARICHMFSQQLSKERPWKFFVKYKQTFVRSVSCLLCQRFHCFDSCL